METAIISLVCVAVLLIGTVTTVFTSFKAVSTVSDSIKSMEDKASESRRTEIAASIAVYSNPITMWVSNNGQTNLEDFAKWDIIVEYTTSGTKHVTYLTRSESGTLGANQWVLQGIYLPSTTAEVYDLGILNPGEQARIDIGLFPVMDQQTTARITVCTDNGVTSQCMVTRN